MAIKMSKKSSKAKKIVKKKSSVAKKSESSAIKHNFKIPNGKYVEAIGRRKMAIARVRIYEGQGDSVVNGKLISDYFANVKNSQAFYMKPFEVTGTKGKFALTVKVFGSGINAQLDAVIHGIARALVKYNPEFRTFLKPAGYLTRDDRMKETRKIGMGGKARRKRQSPKR